MFLVIFQRGCSNLKSIQAMAYINLHTVKYFKEAFYYFGFKHFVSRSRDLPHPNVKLIVRSCNPRLILNYANGYIHHVKRINRALVDFFLLFQLHRVSIEEEVGLGKNRK